MSLSSRQIVFLRGVNVGGRNKLPMATLRALLEGLGCANVATYIQSGNAIFDGATSAMDIMAAIKRDAGFTCAAFLLPVAALKKAAAACPFRAQAEKSGKSVHLFFLDGAPTAAGVEALGALRRPREDFAVSGRTLYLFTPEGVADSKIAERLDRTLGVISTARNWNTVTKMIELAEAA